MAGLDTAPSLRHSRIVRGTTMTPMGTESSTRGAPGHQSANEARSDRGQPDRRVKALDRRQYLSRIKDVLRIERLLQCAHRLDRFRAEFGREVLLLALPDAVFSGAGAAQRLGALHQAMHEVLA